MKHLRHLLAALLALALLAALPLAVCAEDAGMTPEDMYQRGLAYYKGDGVEQSYELALQWFQKAADLGYDMAMYYLGVMYENGRGVPQDDELARQWYQKAADLGNESAKAKLQ